MVRNECPSVDGKTGGTTEAALSSSCWTGVFYFQGEAFMNPTVRIVLIVLGLLIGAAGVIIVYLAPKIVAKSGLAEKKPIDPALAENLTAEQQEKHRFDMAVLDVKIKGLLVAAPGFILLLVMYSYIKI
jgi:hypothetical protein